jgi:hypothetical protein
VPALVAGIHVLRHRGSPSIAMAAKSFFRNTRWPLRSTAFSDRQENRESCAQHAAAVGVNIPQATALVAKPADIDTTPAYGKIVPTSKLGAGKWGMQ